VKHNSLEGEGDKGENKKMDVEHPTSNVEYKKKPKICPDPFGDRDRVMGAFRNLTFEIFFWHLGFRIWDYISSCPSCLNNY
jgi:hypothetical protein